MHDTPDFPHNVRRPDPRPARARTRNMLVSLAWWLIWGFVGFGPPTDADAMSAVSTKGAIACLSRQWAQDMVDFVIAEDRTSFQNYITWGRCFIMKSGLRVTVTDPPGLLDGTAEFVYEGVRLWTTRSGLTDYR